MGFNFSTWMHTPKTVEKLQPTNFDEFILHRTKHVEKCMTLVENLPGPAMMSQMSNRRVVGKVAWKLGRATGHSRICMYIVRFLYTHHLWGFKMPHHWQWWKIAFEIAPEGLHSGWPRCEWVEWYFPILAGKSHHKNRQIRLMEEIQHQLTGSFFGGISSHPGHLLRHRPRVFVGAVPRSAWPRRVVQHWSLGACMRRPEKKGTAGCRFC